MVQSSDEISVEEEDSRSGERKTVNNLTTLFVSIRTWKFYH